VQPNPWLTAQGGGQDIREHVHLTPTDWVLALLGALCIGLSKTGLGGFGMLGVALFAQLLPARVSTGFVLPLLICADVVAVSTFRRHAIWKHILRMFFPAATGILIGFFALRTPLLKSNDNVKMLIGAIVTALIVFTYYRRQLQARQAAIETATDGASAATTDKTPAALPPLHVMGIGLLAGFLTMVANASGPVMTLYLLAIGLPKLEFIGTGAYYFLILNCFKIPFSVGLGLFTGPSLLFDATIAPAVIAGALWGKWLIGFLNQKLFENLALLFALLSGLNLLFTPLIEHALHHH